MNALSVPRGGSKSISISPAAQRLDTLGKGRKQQGPSTSN